MRIQKWELVGRQTRQDSDREAAGLQQQVLVSRGPDGNTTSTHFTNGALVLAFQNLFLRPATGVEEDIVFTEDDLKYVAEMVWSLQDGE